MVYFNFFTSFCSTCSPMRRILSKRIVMITHYRYSDNPCESGNKIQTFIYAGKVPDFLKAYLRKH